MSNPWLCRNDNFSVLHATRFKVKIQLFKRFRIMTFSYVINANRSKRAQLHLYIYMLRHTSSQLRVA